MLPKDELPGELFAARLEEYALLDVSPLIPEHRELLPVGESLAEIAKFSRGLEAMYEETRKRLDAEFPDAEEPEEPSADSYFGMLEALDIVLDLLAGDFKPAPVNACEGGHLKLGEDGLLLLDDDSYNDEDED